jgi:hypothetical protein
MTAPDLYRISGDEIDLAALHGLLAERVLTGLWERARAS